MHYLLHDFTSPSIELYLDTSRDEVRRVEIAMLGGDSCFVVYWAGNELDPLNPKLLEEVGLSFRGKMLVFRQRKMGRRLVNLRKGDGEVILRALSW
jgi:hypothetical protein